jgi:hypothetical protein
MIRKTRKAVGKDVEETMSWGIDIYTRKNIIFVLPETVSEDEKFHFIQHKLLKSVNLQVKKYKKAPREIYLNL